MNLSFCRSQKLCVRGLVGVMVLCLAIALISLRDVVRGMHHQVEVQVVKTERLTQMASSFYRVGLNFYRQRVEGNFDLPGLLKPLDAIRHLAEALEQVSLTQEERQYLDRLVVDEKRIRTALHLFATSGLADPSQESAAQVETELAPIIGGAIDQANDSSRHVSTALKTHNEELIQSLYHTALALLAGAVLTCILGIMTNRLLKRRVDRPLRAILTATYELMSGNFAHRLQVPFSGAMGELADGIDAVAHLLETRTPPPQNTHNGSSRMETTTPMRISGRVESPRR